MATEVEKGRYIEAVGRRKTSVARVRIVPSGKNEILVNTKKIESYFPTEELRTIVQSPFEKVNQGHFQVSARLSGGGIHSQAEALRHGISRAMVKHEHEVRSLLKKLGYLTRDSRMKERRKFGLKKARRAPQWSKR